MIDIKIQKNGYRRKALAIRKCSNTKSNNLAINKNLSVVIPADETKVIAGYLSIGSEASPISFMSKRALSQKVSVPIVEKAGKALKFSIWTPFSKLEMGDFGVAIPQVKNFIDPDVVIVPMLAFDGRGARLGYGGGFYDRTLSALRFKKKITAIGIAFSEQEVEELPIEKNDQFVDCIVTESNTFWF